ncbi:enoyl-CoA hydratase-related protein [Pseudogracilibacillus auburnensis]|uniref:enoyl-CoA hydratase-related protein n=1 Tax=Pseudogracilibacillus auburnensis TaxID=1494959 RepID=UPI001A966645|nr:enoyl-CoA hydratase-related protein [Pseudogracilibacillus auburnensis]MBO1003186.1 enoyl-CoA hydratase/isomerase family protein [Pseudogracilibacillus auburnensis]
MNFENIIFTTEQHIAIVYINRPDVRNALNQKTWEELEMAMDYVTNDDQIRACIITGSGDKAFVAGADVSWLNNRTPNDMFKISAQTVCNKISQCLKPVIAAINGFALGGGCEIALACDIRYSSENAKLGQPEINLGIIPAAGGTQRLARLVGMGMAKELIFTGKLISAEEALRIGLVDKVVKHEELMDKAKELAEEIVSKPPLAVQMAKRAINIGVSTDLNTGLSYELAAQSILYGTEDKAEGTSAFLEKRKAKFLGK